MQKATNSRKNKRTCLKILAWLQCLILIIAGLLTQILWGPFSGHTVAGDIEKARLTASDGAAMDEFGYTVAISGDYAVVGAPLDDDNGADSGSAYFFKRLGDKWSEAQKLTASDGTAFDAFGNAVAISGRYAIVGAGADDDNGSGSAYIFERWGDKWSEVQKLYASDGALHAWFGESVAISGNYAVVGAPLDDDNGENAGSAYIFERLEGKWSEVQKLTASDGAAHDWFGEHVAVSGNWVIVSAMFDNNINGSAAGSAYIFERLGGKWFEVQKLTASDGASFDTFGNTVAISGKYAIVGAGSDDDNGSGSGSAYTFECLGGKWFEVQKLTASDGAAGDHFGYPVLISADYAIVGAPLDDDNGSNSGSVYVFKRSGNKWSEVQKLTASDGGAEDRFGESVALSGDYVIIGVWRDDDKGFPSGSAYIECIDIDRDTVCQATDNCPNTANPDQTDTDKDGLGDACDECTDQDGDGLCSDVDPCPNDPGNDSDGDGLCGDVDPCPSDPGNDSDDDGLCGDIDSCPADAGNSGPLLSNGNVLPAGGSTATIFSFQVDYYNEYGNPPLVKNVIISSDERHETYAMKLLRGTVSNGTYYYEMRLGKGVHTYYFAFDDGYGQNCITRLPQAGAYYGPTPSAGTTYYVPDNCSTIQAALDNALTGDTVIVRDGTYTGEGNRNLNFYGKGITLRSENGEAKSIIDCENSYGKRGFLFVNGETAATVVAGFQIVNCGGGGLMDGAGMLIYGASPTIIDCHIKNCSISISGFGAGVYIQDGSPTFSQCNFINNRTTFYGGGIYCMSGSPTFTNCRISGNAAQSGGGLWVGLCNLTMNNCLIYNNTAESDGGGIYNSIYSSGYKRVLNNCIFRKNTAAFKGGGMCNDRWGSGTNSLTMSNCIWFDNVSQQGGGIFNRGITVDLANAILWNNTASVNGPQIYHTNWGPYHNPLTISDSNVMGGVAGVYDESGTVSWGSGNISQDPGLHDADNGDLLQQRGWPGIAAGMVNNIPGTRSYDVMRPLDGSGLSAGSAGDS